MSLHSFIQCDVCGSNLSLAPGMQYYILDLEHPPGPGYNPVHVRSTLHVCQDCVPMFHELVPYWFYNG